MVCISRSEEVESRNLSRRTTDIAISACCEWMPFMVALGCGSAVKGGRTTLLHTFTAIHVMLQRKSWRPRWLASKSIGRTTARHLVANARMV